MITLEINTGSGFFRKIEWMIFLYWVFFSLKVSVRFVCLPRNIFLVLCTTAAATLVMNVRLWRPVEGQD